jgi:hypothetical protein
MTARGGRGGPRVPDGVQRPSSLPMARGPNRSDLAELPGTPGTPLPPSPAEPSLQQGQVGALRQRLGSIPLESVSPGVGLDDDTQAPDEPVTAGAELGAGPGPEGLLPSQNQLNSQMTAEEMRYAYPLIMRLATLPNATTETKIMAQRLRANLTLSPEQMPVMEPSDRNGANR